MSRAILLVDHGSRRDDANALLEEIAIAMRRRKPDAIVRTAHLEIAEPTLGDGIDACAADGATEVVVVPWFLGPGRHSSRDIPEQVAAARSRHPRLRVRVAEPLGFDERLIDVALERAARAPDV